MLPPDVVEFIEHRLELCATGTYRCWRFVSDAPAAEGLLASLLVVGTANRRNDDLA
jgi:hypothetical protein